MNGLPWWADVAWRVSVVAGVVIITAVARDLTTWARARGWIICRTQTWIRLGVGAFAGAVWGFACSLDGSMVGGIVAGLILFVTYAVLWIEEWRAHRKHDEDCKYGPRRRRGGATARLTQWRKVALNPAFTPT